ncbi:glycosyltransferase family 2 protein [bacterium]|nr:glycosyltransferase family 2 protein [bacterium]
MKYTIITPVKNEASYIRYTIESVISQSIIPLEWIIVDDGSTDETLLILREFESKNDWIKVIENKTKHEDRSGGAKVVRAFYVGFQEITNHDYEFIVKLDGDLKLPSNYFEEVSNAFINNPKIGICGGYILNKIENRYIEEIKKDYHVRGAFKAVRKKCFEEIGGFKEIWNWDGLDLMEAFRLGWKSKVLDLPVIHYKPTASAYNPVKFQFKCGRYAYKLRNNFMLTFFRSARVINKKPYFFSTLLYLSGYFYSYLKNEEAIINKELGDYTNSFHINRIKKLIKKKMRL